MKKTAQSLINDDERLDDIKRRKHDLSLLIQGGEKRLEASRTLNEEKVIEKSILELRVVQAHKILSNFSSKVYTLEKYKLEIEQVTFYTRHY